MLYYADENILYFNEDSGNVAFSCNEMGILYIDLDNIILNNNFDENDSDTTTHIRFLAWHIKFEKLQAFKKWPAIRASVGGMLAWIAC